MRVVFGDDFNTIGSTKFTVDENLKYRNAICTSFTENIEARAVCAIRVYITPDAECEINIQ